MWQVAGWKDYGRAPLPRSLSLFGQILDILVDRITSGIYPPHSQLPPENSLAVEFGVSRATIHSAIDILASRGLVLRRQRGLALLSACSSGSANRSVSSLLFPN